MNDQANPQDTSRDPSDNDQVQERLPQDPIRPPNPTFLVRVWHILWRRRQWYWHRIIKLRFSELVTIFLTLGILLVGATQAYIYWQQEVVMQASLAQNERSASLNRGQLSVANRNAKTAEDTLQEIRNEQRPWIVVKDAKITTLEANKNVTVDFIVSNFGHSPALDARFVGALFITSEPNKDVPPTAKVQINSVVAPPALDMHLSLHSLDPLPAEKVERAKLPDVKYYIYGEGTYKDTSARRGLHHTQFCVFLIYGTVGVNPCPDNMRYKNTAD